MQKWKQLMIFPASLGHGRVGSVFPASGICQREEAVRDPANWKLTQCHPVSAPPNNCAGTHVDIWRLKPQEMGTKGMFCFVCSIPCGKVVTAPSLRFSPTSPGSLQSIINWLRTKPKRRMIFFWLWVSKQLDVFFVAWAPSVMSHFRMQRAICCCSLL